MRLQHLLIGLVALGVTHFSATRAVVITTLQTNVAPAGTGAYTPTFPGGGPSSSDILQGKLPVASTGTFTQESSTGPSALTNGTVTTQYGTGTAESNHAAYATAGNTGGTSLTYALSGIYNLSSMVVYGGWNDAGRDALVFDVLTSTDGGVNYTPLISFTNNPGEAQGTVTTPVSHRVAITNDAGPNIATGVTHVRLTFGAVENGYTGYTEIDVFGSQQFLPGDADRDGNVDLDDFFLISNNFYTVPSAIGLQGDIVADNFVDALDFRLWKESASASVLAEFNALGGSVPEPATMVGLAVILATGWAWRRR